MLSMQELKQVLFEYQKARRVMVEKWIAGAREHFGGENGELACDGCMESFCCYQLPLAHPMEGLAIAFRLLEDGKSDLMARVQMQGVKQLEILERCGFTQEKFLDGTFDMEEACREWMEIGDGCVFLKDDRCQIYTLRPIVCSTYFTVDRCPHQRPPGAEVPTLDNLKVAALSSVMTSEVLCILLNEEKALIPPTVLAAAVYWGGTFIEDQLGVRNAKAG